jgi:hypothetical protein
MKTLALRIRLQFGLRYGLLAAAILGMVMLGVGTGCSEDDKLTITKLSKQRGIAGDTLTIYGTGFQAGGRRHVRVFFDSKKAKVLRFKGNTEFTVSVPGGIDFGKTVDIKVVFEPGGIHTYEKAFTYVKPEQTTVDDLVGGGTK